jgi:hypothetical protein
MRGDPSFYRQDDVVGALKKRPPQTDTGVETLGAYGTRLRLVWPQQPSRVVLIAKIMFLI